MELTKMTKEQLISLIKDERSLSTTQKAEITDLKMSAAKADRDRESVKAKNASFETVLECIRVELEDELRHSTPTHPSGYYPMDAAQERINLHDMPGLIGELVGERNIYRKMLEASK